MTEQQPIEQPVQEIVENVPNLTESVSGTTESIPELTESVQTEQPQVPALERIPKDKNGQPIYEQAETPDIAWDAIVEQTDGDEAMAQTVADGMVADKEAALKKLEKGKVKGGKTVDEKIIAEKERKAAIEKVKGDADIWKKIAQTAQRRRDEAEMERQRIVA